MKTWLNKIQEFINQVWEQCKMCTRPSASELKESTLVIVVTMAVLGAFISTSDMAISWILKMVITMS